MAIISIYASLWGVKFIPEYLLNIPDDQRGIQC